MMNLVHHNSTIPSRSTSNMYLNNYFDSSIGSVILHKQLIFSSNLSDATIIDSFTDPVLKSKFLIIDLNSSASLKMYAFLK